MTSPKKILLVGAECAPFAKTGGLADVIGTLPAQLKKLGADARVMMPLHRQIKEKYRYELYHICTFYVTLGWRTQFCGIETLTVNGIQYYFVDNEYYFGGPIYKGGEAEGEQYAFFSRAVLEALPLIDFMPDVIHANDWHTAMIPMLIKTQYSGDVGMISTLFTIHNIAYQGRFSPFFVKDLLGVPDSFITAQYMEAYGDANFLKAGIVFSDKVNTVSPSYAHELKYPYYSEGMDGVLNSRGGDFCGIINGIDTISFDPHTDKNIKNHYTSGSLYNKKQDKLALIEELSLNADEHTPVISMVTRLTEQKGIDLVMYALSGIMAQDICLVVLGSGDKKYEDFFFSAQAKYPGKIAYSNKYDEALSHRIYAGSDLFLMPSKFEPCGISQMIAMRYGTLPIVRETGGLKDTVKPYNEFEQSGTGFSFANYNADEMLGVIKLALSVYRDEKRFRGIQKQAMAEDFSFEASAKKYLELYKSCIERRL